MKALLILITTLNVSNAFAAQMISSPCSDSMSNLLSNAILEFDSVDQATDNLREEVIDIMTDYSKVACETLESDETPLTTGQYDNFNFSLTKGSSKYEIVVQTSNVGRSSRIQISKNY